MIILNIEKNKLIIYVIGVGQKEKDLQMRYFLKKFFLIKYKKLDFLLQL